jgi:hypothetical protein
MLALGVLVCLSNERAPASGKGASAPKPPAASKPANKPPKLPQISYYRRPAGYRPRQGARLVPVTTDFTFTFNSDTGKVRTIEPPAEFDDKGNIKKPTAEELKKAKGDDPAEQKLAGYKSDISEVKVGDLVEVALSVFKPTDDKKDAAKKDKADKEKAALDKPKEGKWVVAGGVLGKVTKITPGNTDSGTKLTVRGQTVQVVYGRTNPRGHKHQTISPETAQATLILVGRRPAGTPAP